MNILLLFLPVNIMTVATDIVIFCCVVVVIENVHSHS